VENSGGIQASLRARYATALFELARDETQLEAVGASLAALRQALRESEDLRELTTSPLISPRPALARCDVGSTMQLDPITANFLGVLAQNRRLGQLGNVIRAFNSLPPIHRGETTAEVTPPTRLATIRCRPSSQSQEPSRPRRRVDLNVDPAILAGSSSRSAAR
jgi:F-type H+-transporting ATPase subunit delta